MVFVAEKFSCRCYYHRRLCWKFRPSPIDITVDPIGLHLSGSIQQWHHWSQKINGDIVIGSQGRGHIVKPPATGSDLHWIGTVVWFTIQLCRRCIANVHGVTAALRCSCYFGQRLRVNAGPWTLMTSPLNRLREMDLLNILAAAQQPNICPNGDLTFGQKLGTACVWIMTGKLCSAVGLTKYACE